MSPACIALSHVSRHLTALLVCAVYQACQQPAHARAATAYQFRLTCHLSCCASVLSVMYEVLQCQPLGICGRHVRELHIRLVFVRGYMLL